MRARTDNSPRPHVIEPTVATVHDAFSNAYPPVANVRSGERIVLRTLDARWNLQPYVEPGVPAEVLEHEKNGHCLTGPIFVEGALPGSIVGIQLHSLQPSSWGWTEAGRLETDVNRRLGLPGGRTASLLWSLDVDLGLATDQHGRDVQLAPFLGVIGLAPSAPGEHSTIPPRETGGNIDCKELTAGSTLYLPVACEGALLFVGDGHAAQADGELSETAIECGMTTDLSVELLRPAAIPTPSAVTSTARLTFGFGNDLHAAAFKAANLMIDWLQTLLGGVDRETAVALSSLVVNLRVTQVVNEVCGVHASLQHDSLAKLIGLTPVEVATLL